jgi:hypothetical protein
MPLWTPTELQGLQQQVLTAANQINPAVIGCTAIVQTQQVAWALQYQLCTEYAAEEVGWFTSSGTMADQGQALLSQLQTWVQTVNTACPGKLPSNLNVNPAPPPGLADTIQAATGLAVAVAAGLAIWFVGKSVTR